MQRYSILERLFNSIRNGVKGKSQEARRPVEAAKTIQVKVDSLLNWKYLNGDKAMWMTLKQTGSIEFDD